MNSHGRPQQIPAGCSFIRFMELYNPTTLTGRRFKEAWKEHSLADHNPTSQLETSDLLKKHKLTSHLAACKKAWVAYHFHFKKASK